MLRTALLAAGLVFSVAGAASAMPIAPAVPAPAAAPIIQVDSICGPGYHLGSGQMRCWPNGGGGPGYCRPGLHPGPYGKGCIPAEGPAYLPPMPSYKAPYPPGIPTWAGQCPYGMHPGSGDKRCWPNR
ncbi:MAG: hypothetical protein J0H63_11325 [Rhizobiales bacterium]|nr:hypothetical protein [Hyphomicrobiales bacterium]MBN9010684.1 hypothetical protein [Hyphomicrobiales bacterium]